ncbi:MAG: hypothetical protein FWF11_00295 [Coriobacteriia bacterium]|nr:hypothetical protein [Coriobacteriia bacterium]
MGEGDKRSEFGVTAVIVHNRTMACHMCIEWVNRVYIDDVFSGGTAKDGNYPLLSTAIEGGLYHPNCMDTHSTYYEGITTVPVPPTEADKAEAVERYNALQRQRTAMRHAHRHERIADGTLDPELAMRHRRLADRWTDKAAQLMSPEQLAYLSRTRDRLSSTGYMPTFETPELRDLIEGRYPHQIRTAERLGKLDYKFHFQVDERHFAGPVSGFQQTVGLADGIVDGKGWELKTILSGRTRRTIEDAFKSAYTKEGVDVIVIDNFESLFMPDQIAIGYIWSLMERYAKHPVLFISKVGNAHWFK